MEPLRDYVGKKIDLNHVKDEKRLRDFGFTCRYLPDPPEDFDEFEFGTRIGELDNLGLMITVQSMKIVKMFFASIDPDNPDLVKGLSEAQLTYIFEQAQDEITGFLNFITE